MNENSWFIDVVFQNLTIEESEHKPMELASSSELAQYSPKQSSYKLLSEFEGKKVNIAYLKLRVQSIVGGLL